MAHSGIPSVKVGLAENKPKMKWRARHAGEPYLYSCTASDILHNANCYPTLPAGVGI